jgi:hypothetical protein
MFAAISACKIRGELGWRPVTSLGDGVALTWRWLEGQQVPDGGGMNENEQDYAYQRVGRCPICEEDVEFAAHSGAAEPAKSHSE